jgi:hypothetical protein
MSLQASVFFDGGFVLTGTNGAGGTVTAAGSTPSPDLTWTDGNSSGAANQVFAANFTIGVGNTTTYDLKGGGGEENVINQALSLSSVKEVAISISSPVDGKYLTFGPNGVANSCPLWFGNATTGNETVYDSVCHVNRLAAGWAVTTGNKKINLTNSGNVSISGNLLVIGVI